MDAAPYGETEKKMKILHVASHWAVIRGGAIQLSRMAEEQHSRGHDVTVVFPDQLLRNPVVRKKNIDSWKALGAKGIKIKKIGFRSINGTRRLGSFLKKNSFDIIHVHRNEALIKTTKVLELYQISTPVVVQRGTITSFSKAHLVSAFKSPCVKAYTVVAKAVKDVLINVLGKDSEKMIHIVYGSVDVDKFSPAPKDQKILSLTGFPENAKIIGSLSSYRKSKRLDLLLNVLSEIMAKDKEIYAVFLGANMHKEIIPMAKNLGIYEKCYFAGFQEDIRPWLSIMDLSVVAADDQEGLSGVLRESLSMEIPAVSTSCAGNIEIIQHGKTGLLVPVNDKKALENSILWAVSHHKEMQKMAENGRKWVTSHCSAKIQVDQLDKIYASML